MKRATAPGLFSLGETDVCCLQESAMKSLASGRASGVVFCAHTLLISGAQQQARILREHRAGAKCWQGNLQAGKIIFVFPGPASPWDHKHNGYELARPRSLQQNKHCRFWQSLLPLALGSAHKWPLLRGPDCENCPHQAIVSFYCTRVGISSPGCQPRLPTELSWRP